MQTIGPQQHTLSITRTPRTSATAVAAAAAVVGEEASTPAPFPAPSSMAAMRLQPMRRSAAPLLAGGCSNARPKAAQKSKTRQQRRAAGVAQESVPSPNI